MHTNTRVSVLLLFASFLQLAAVASADAHQIIYITRHGEKLWALGCLNATGETKLRACCNIRLSWLVMSPHDFAQVTLVRKILSLCSTG
jgi:hypothetical protein